MTEKAIFGYQIIKIISIKFINQIKYHLFYNSPENKKQE